MRLYKVFNKNQHRVSMVLNITEEEYETYEQILAKDFGVSRRKELSKIVFKVLNNRGIFPPKFTP